MAPSYYEKRHNIIEAIVAFLPSVPPDSEALNVIRDFATATENKLTPHHREIISKAIESRSHRPIPRSYGEPVKPSKLESYDIAVALTLMEAELRKTMACWLKSTILCHREIRTRADRIKQFVKTAKACLEMHNYNSAAVIGSVLLRWKSRPETDIPRTMAALENSTQESIEQLAKLIEPVNNFEAYKKTVVKEKAEAYIPWLPVHLADVKNFLANSARIIEVDNMQLINFERYRELANKVPGYQIPPHLERKRKDKNIDTDYWTRRPQIRSLGFQPS
ncbi:ras guanine nucleotide exchange factor domain-containing protein [Mycena olivaceomarginata]|nr:ras guanine nucleotide exchange factor domain-containing protein [Mycena olivaceomarginata]